MKLKHVFCQFCGRNPTVTEFKNNKTCCICWAERSTDTPEGKRTIVINDAAVEVIAKRRIDKVTQGEEYAIPSKDTWLAWLRANVRDDLEAAHAAQNPEQETTE